MKKILILLTCLLFVSAMYSQQDQQFSLNMFNHASINPGAAGINEGVCATALIREQWMGFEGHPSTKVFNVNTPLAFVGVPIGTGLTILTDDIGFYKNVSLNLAAAYQIDLGNGVLGIGANFGFNNQSLSNTDWFVGDGGSGANSDPLIPNDESAFVFDLGMGVFYKDDKLYAGFSSLHLNEPVVEFDQTAKTFLKRHYYFTSGYHITLPNPLFELTPSVFIKYDGSSMQMDFNATIEYDKRFWGGVSYRLEDAYVAMFGMNLIGGYSFGLAWDFPISEMGTYASGSFEFFARYCFHISRNTKEGRHKGILNLE